jgi:hypothetical protein
VGHLLYYKRSVKSDKVVFPQDADIVVNPEEVINFRLRVPQGQMPEGVVGMALVMARDSVVPVAGAEFGTGTDWDPRTSKGYPDTVQIQASPRSYYVAYGFKYPRVIGRINLKESDAGRTVEMEPM